MERPRRIRGENVQRLQIRVRKDCSCIFKYVYMLRIWKGGGEVYRGMSGKTFEKIDKKEDEEDECNGN